MPHGITFCVFSGFLDLYIRRGILPYVADAKIEPFLAIQAKPGDEEPVLRMERVTRTARDDKGRLVVAVDAGSAFAMTTIQYCSSMAIPCGLIIKTNNCLPIFSALHQQAPLAFVLGVGNENLPKLFPNTPTTCDKSNGLSADAKAKNFVLEQLGALVQ